MYIAFEHTAQPVPSFWVW